LSESGFSGLQDEQDFLITNQQITKSPKVF